MCKTLRRRRLVSTGIHLKPLVVIPDLGWRRGERGQVWLVMIIYELNC